MTEANSTENRTAPILAAQASYLIEVARRAPSLHNTQPWRFTVSGDAIELYPDARRQLHVDPDGREMIISCGAALYGLRLAVRSLGYLPEVELLPGRAGPGPISVRIAPSAWASSCSCANSQVGNGSGSNGPRCVCRYRTAWSSWRSSDVIGAGRPGRTRASTRWPARPGSNSTSGR